MGRCEQATASLRLSFLSVKLPKPAACGWQETQVKSWVSQAYCLSPQVSSPLGVSCLIEGKVGILGVGILGSHFGKCSLSTLQFETLKGKVYGHEFSCWHCHFLTLGS